MNHDDLIRETARATMQDLAFTAPEDTEAIEAKIAKHIAQAVTRAIDSIVSAEHWKWKETTTGPQYAYLLPGGTDWKGHYNTREDAISAAVESLSPIDDADAILTAVIIPVTSASLVPDAHELICDIGDRATDLVGEPASDYVDEFDPRTKATLQIALNKWATKHLPKPSFFLIDANTIEP